MSLDWFENPDQVGYQSCRADLFLPEIREEAVIEETSPCRPVVTGVAYAEILIFDSVLVEGLSERLYTEVEHTFLFIATLSQLPCDGTAMVPVPPMISIFIVFPPEN